ncbi:deoxynucleotide monophosphate kinase [Bajunvirus bajun]|uniref:Deoxynucleotide monophosphate kinase n=1 Tax=Brevundimonas phage vB_BgoS-Bajun TaxID=2948594 RepID=A0A9E7N543_9CAUD|nr:deoxynucleotide monophosphate kinase [Brevundimonas phage vB_BgoS-Bajun]
MKKIVAITGKRGHGKSTASDALEALGYRNIAFGDPVRQVVEIVYGVSMHEMLDPVLKEQVLNRWPFKSPRELMQIVGTDMFRKTKFNDGKPLDETWVKCFEREAQEYSHIVCSDLRFPNEADALREMAEPPAQGELFAEAEVTIIKIVNPHVDLHDVASQHASETEIDKIEPDHTIINGGTIPALHAIVREITGAH